MVAMISISESSGIGFQVKGYKIETVKFIGYFFVVDVNIVRVIIVVQSK